MKTLTKLAGVIALVISLTSCSHIKVYEVSFYNKNNFVTKYTYRSDGDDYISPRVPNQLVGLSKGDTAVIQKYVNHSLLSFKVSVDTIYTEMR